MTARRRTKIPVKALERRGRGLYQSLSDAVDVLTEAERREKALTAGESENRADLEKTFPALEGKR